MRLTSTVFDSVFIEGNPDVKPGDFVDVKVTDSSDYDLFAEVVKEPYLQLSEGPPRLRRLKT